MKIIIKTLLGLSLSVLLVNVSYAASLQSIDSSVHSSGKSTLRLNFDSRVAIPQTFELQQPPSVVLDFPGSVRGMDQRTQNINSKSVKNVRIAGVEDKLRVMVALNRTTRYTCLLYTSPSPRDS